MSTWNLPSPTATHTSTDDHVANGQQSESMHKKESSDDTLVGDHHSNGQDFLSFISIDNNDYNPLGLDIGLGGIGSYDGGLVDYLDPRVDSTSNSEWPTTCAPSDLLSFNSSEDMSYDFSFNAQDHGMTLPSPPSSTTGTSSASVSDPPSPSQPLALPNGLFGQLPLPLPSLTFPPQMIASSTFPTPTQQAAGTIKKSGKSSPAAASNANANSNTTNTRPKTSHTTIERRYRTNLNARIIGLRLAVPALRVLDKSLAATSEYTVDDRGYVDGVKAAKKNSKAVILGKATEYITVLKRREVRLSNEVLALKSLLLSLLPPEEGAQFVARWEEEYKRVNGDERSDELPIGSGDDGEEDYEDGDGDDDDEKEREKERPKKKLKKESVPAPLIPATTTTSTLSEIGAAEQPMKRKRGRPRKVQPAPTLPTHAPPSEGQVKSEQLEPASTQFVTHPMSIDVQQPGQQVVQVEMQEQGPARYLLAAFAFFSLFSSSPASHNTNSSPPTHEGMVLSPLSPPSTQPQSWIPSEILKSIQLITTLLLLVSILAPYLPDKVRKSKVLRLFTVGGPSPTSNSQEDEGKKPESPLGSPSASIIGLAGDVFFSLLGLRVRNDNTKFVCNALTNGQLETLPIVTRLRLYISLGPSWTLERILLARSLPFSPPLDKKWEAAKTDGKLRYSGSVTDALVVLAEHSKTSSASVEARNVKAVLELDECERMMRRKAKLTFEGLVLGSSTDDREDEECQKKETPRFEFEFEGELGRTLNSLHSALGTQLDRETIDFLRSSSDTTKGDTGKERERQTKDLILATLLFSTLFPSYVHPISSSRMSSNKPATTVTALLSPPPSPNVNVSTGLRNRHNEEAKRRHELRCLLASRTFEDLDPEDGRMEEARDFVVGVLEKC